MKLKPRGGRGRSQMQQKKVAPPSHPNGEIEILCTLENFKLRLFENEVGLDFGNVFLDESQTVKAKWKTHPALIQAFGTYWHNQMDGGFISSSMSEASYRDMVSNLYNGLVSFQGDVEHAMGHARWLESVVFSLWCLCDNAVGLSDYYFANFVHGGAGCIHKKHGFSNSAGLKMPSEFGIAELKFAFDMAKKLGPLSSDEGRSLNVERIGREFYFDHLNTKDLKRLNRLDRVMVFLHLARSYQYLPLKVAFYTLVLECLISTKDEGASNQVISRVPKYLGGDKPNRTLNAKTITAAYVTRNDVFHGNEITNSIDEIKATSIKMDMILRGTLINLLHFQPEYFRKTSTEIDEFFRDIESGKVKFDSGQDMRDKKSPEDEFKEQAMKQIKTLFPGLIFPGENQQ